MTRENAKQMPATYFVRHMVPGVCGYNDGNVFIDLDVMKKMAPTFAGKPVFVGHQPVDVETVEADADGYVFDCFYNEVDGWFWSRICIHSDKAHQAVRDGWAVSNAYMPSEYGAGGQYLNVDYNQKVLNAAFTHLAIVANPRYEAATIMTPEEFRLYQEEKRNEFKQLQNSKDEKKGISMFKIFNKTAAKTEVTNEADIREDSIVEFEGKEYTVKEFRERVNAKKNEADEKDDKKNSVVLNPKVGAEALENEDEDKSKENKKNDDGEDEEMENDDGKVTVDGEEVSMKDLKNSYRNSKNNAKKNEADDKEKENSKDDGKKHFEELQNANTKMVTFQNVEVITDKVARGAARY